MLDLKYHKNMKYRLRRLGLALVALLVVSVLGLQQADNDPNNEVTIEPSEAVLANEDSPLVSELLSELDIKGRAPKTGYSRGHFGSGWGDIKGCSLRNVVLNRDLENVKLTDNCLVDSGTLKDPYTGNTIDFERGEYSSLVQVDHVVALSDAWQKGAQSISYESRYELANDPLNLLAVDGPANQIKGDGDAASWLPSNKGFRCQYVARQISVKFKYLLWVTQAEFDAMKNVLSGCKDQPAILD